MSKWKFLATISCGACIGTWVTMWMEHRPAEVSAKEPSLTALDYEQLIQLTNRYAYGIDTCSNDGYDYADVFTPDGIFIDKNSDEGFKQGGRVLAKGREALATLISAADRADARRRWSGPVGPTSWSTTSSRQRPRAPPEGFICCRWESRGRAASSGMAATKTCT